MSIEADRLGRIEQHLEHLKKDRQQQQKALQSIESALVGNSFNGNKGIIHTVNGIDERLNKLEGEFKITDNNMSQLKWFSRIIALAIISFIVGLITSK